MENKWISIKDKKPENTGHNFSEKVLICDASSGYIGMARYDFEFNSWNQHHLPDITHWMELPPPPKI